MALTNGKVNIMLNADEFKNTTQILREMAAAWSDMTDVQRAAALELLGGKRQANVLSSLLQNFQTVEDVIQSSAASSGSALKENQVYLDSMQGRIDKLTNSMQAMWVNAMDSELLKFFISVADSIVQATDKLGLFNVVFAALMAKTAFSGKKFGIANLFTSMIQGADGATRGIMLLGKALPVASTGFKIFNAAATMGISLLAGLVIKGIIKLADELIVTSEELKEAAKQATDAYKDAQSTLSSTRNTIKEISADYQALAVGVDEFGNNINLNTSQYERYNEIVNQIADMFPEMVRGYTAEGNAIIKNKGNVEALTSAYKALRDEADNTLLSKADDIMGNYKTTFSGKWYESGPDTDALKIKAARELEKMLKNQDTYDFSWMSNTNQYRGQTDTIVKLLENAGIEDKSFFESSENYVKRAVSEYPNIVQSIVNTWESVVNTAVSNVKPLVSAYLDTSIGYAGLTSEQKSTIDSVVSSFDEEFFNQFDGDASKMYNAIESMIQNIKTAGIDGEYTLVLNTKTQFNNNDMSIGDYQARIQEFITQIDDLQKQGLLSENDAKYIKISLGFEFDDNGNIQDDINSMVNYAKTIIDSKLHDQILTLNYSDLQIINNDKFNVSGATITTWQQLQEEIKKAKVAMTEDFTVSNFTDYADSINALQENISAYQEALEKLESGSFTISDFVELIKQFPELGKGVDASSKSFKGLDKNLRKAIKNSPKSLIKDLKQLRQQLIEAGKSTDAIDQLIDSIENMPDEMVENLAKHFGTLADEISRANQAQSELSDSLDDDTNDNYETRVKAYEEMIKLFNAGAIGSESKLWDISKFFFGDNPEAVAAIAEKNADALWELVEARQKWYTLGDNDTYTYDGIESFIKYVASQTDVLEKFGATWTYANGVFNFDLNNEQWEEFAHAIGLSAEEFSDLMVQIGQFFKINWTNANDYEQHLDKVNQQITEIASGKTLTAKERLEELNRVMQDEYGLGDVDLTTRPEVTFDESSFGEWKKYYQNIVDNAKQYSEEYVDFVKSQIESINKGDSTATLYSSTYYRSDFGDLQPGESDAAIVLTPILPDGTVLSPEQLEKYAGQLLNGEKIDIPDGITLGIFEGDDFKEKADSFAENVHKAQSVWLELSQSIAANPLELTFDDPENLVKQLNNLKVEATWDGSNVTIANLPDFEQVLHDNGYTPETISQIFATLFHGATDQTTIDFTNSIASIDAIKGVCQESIDALHDLGIATAELHGTSQGAVITVDSSDIDTALSKLGYTEQRISEIKQQWGDSGITINVDANTEEAETGVFDIPVAEDQTFTVTISNYQQTIGDLQTINDFTIKDKSYTVTKTLKTIFGFGSSTEDDFVNGTAHIGGTAHASGSWGVPKTETALVGELGPEIIVDPKSGKWHTVGDTGAEFTTVPKGAIVFNHKQTEQLLKNGYVTGRGKAYASGTAYASSSGSHKTYGNTSGSGSGSGKSSADDTKDQFEEIFDWIEVRLEEINKQLDFKNARLENSVGFAKQNKVIDEMLKLNEKLYDNLIAGANKYYEYAGQLLAKIPTEYRKAAQDGSIAIETFVGEVDEETYNAIQDFREWVQKGDDAVQQAEEVITEVSSLAKQSIDNIATDYGNKNSIRDNIIDQLDAYNALAETKYGSESDKIYQAIIKETNDNIKTLQTQRDKMQAELNKQVEAGNVQKYSQDWYDAVSSIAEVDTEIINLTKDTYDYQDSINELHWDHFDNILSRLEAISNEADNLIDILGSKDLVDETGNWTNEGITSLGLYAQKMEVAEVQAKKYADEIDYLNKNWKKLGYTEREYVEKLEELKEGQYDAIKAYNDTKDAIVDLNKERVDAIKEGIQKEIDAYEELINKKKEELGAEKDLYDFQKNAAEKQKNIADIQRKIASISAAAAQGDTSAIAQKKKLEAELARAKAEQEDMYYERSVSNQQDALDKELENFKDTKDKEIENWDEYLEKTEQVVADSLSVIQANTDAIYQTMQEMGQEYSLSITESLTSPWQDGAIAVQDFSEKFGLSMSSTVEELQKVADKYKRVMDEISNYGDQVVEKANDNASKYQEANNPSKPKFDSPETVVKQPTASGNGSSSHSGMVSGISAVLRQGSTGADVKKLQQALNDLGFNAGTVDGKFGPNTKQAVVRFQSSSKYGGAISADGIVGPNTKKKFKTAGYAGGTQSLAKSGLINIDELGEELVLRAKNGRLTYMEKGSGIIPADLTSNLMEWGELDPQDMLDRNRPAITPSKYIVNNEINLDCSIGTMVNIEHCDQNTLPDVEKIVNKAFDKHMQNLNNSLKRFTR